jgi:methionine biosynthesis protein MetW
MGSAQNKIRIDHRVIASLIKENSRVLDLGCGNGDLLDILIKTKSVHGTGIEIDESAIYKCIEKGLTVAHGDIDSGLVDYSDKRFDYVILNESLQEVLHPERVIQQALRIGKKIIVGVPNFCYLTARLQIFLLGKTPVTRELPYQWYNTPNLRFLSIKDFRHYCRQKGITIEHEVAITNDHQIRILKNLLGHTGIFLLSKD